MSNLNNNIDEFEFEQEPEQERDAAAPVLASMQIFAGHSDDELDLALAALPKRTAPRNTVARVLARIATLPQHDVEMAALSIGLMPPRIKYVPPVLEVNQVVVPGSTAHAEARPNERFNPIGYLIFGLWCSVCVILLYALWPLISALVIGPTPNADLGQRWDAVVHWWNNLAMNFNSFLNVSQPYLLPVVSACAGIAIMLYFFNQQPRRLWYDR